MNIILSIKPKWAEKIYSGEKTIEWRKNAPKNADDHSIIFLYETAPICKVTGCMRFDGATAYDFIHLPIVPRQVLKLSGCVQQKDLDKYQGKSKEIYAWRFYGAFKFIIPKTLEEFSLKRPPQSWCYTEHE